MGVRPDEDSDESCSLNREGPVAGPGTDVLIDAHIHLTISSDGGKIPIHLYEFAPRARIFLNAFSPPIKPLASTW